MTKRFELTRRNFLVGAAGAVTAFGLAGCAPQQNTPTAETGPSSDTPNWLGEAPVYSDADVVATYDADVIVAGMGTSGIFAACSAVENGASCIAIDKADAGSLSNGIRDTLGALGSSEQIANNDNPDRHDVIAELSRQSNGYGDVRLFNVWADRSGETIDWYTERLGEAGRHFAHEVDEKLDLRFKPYDTGHTVQWGEGAEDRNSMLFAVSVLYEYGKSKGLELHSNTAMKTLIVENDRVVGLYAEGPEGIVRYNAKNGVILCTGGYAANEEMMEALQPESLRLKGTDYIFPTNTGDGHKAAAWIGAALDDVHASMIFDRSCIKPDSTGTEGAALFWMGSQPFMKVDLTGNRFMNESGFYDNILHTSLGLPGQTYCTVWDANYHEDITRFEAHGCARLFPHTNGTEVAVFDMATVDAMNEGLLGEGYIAESDTIEGLAEALNLPVESFAASVKRYNELADKGIDEDFGKEPFRLSHMSTPPYRGVRQCGGYLLCTMDGIKISPDMHVLNKKGQPIEGLFAAGDCSGSYFGESYPNLLAGAAAGRSATFGRYAGKLAAEGK